MINVMGIVLLIVLVVLAGSLIYTTVRLLTSTRHPLRILNGALSAAATFGILSLAGFVPGTWAFAMWVALIVLTAAVAFATYRSMKAVGDSSGQDVDAVGSSVEEASVSGASGSHAAGADAAVGADAGGSSRVNTDDSGTSPELPKALRPLTKVDIATFVVNAVIFVAILAWAIAARI